MNKKDIYGIKNWGEPFFEILKNGNIGLKNPLNIKNESVDILTVVKTLKEKFSPPYIIRIDDYLEYMIRLIMCLF